MKHYIDGDQVVVVYDDFVDAQESPTVYIPRASFIGNAIETDGVNNLRPNEVEKIRRLLSEDKARIQVNKRRDMNTYHKIQTVYKRDPENKHRTLLDGEFSVPEFEYLANNNWAFTEKVNGTNIRVMFDKGKITFGGKTDRAQIPALLANRLNDLFLPQTNKFDILFKNGVCLYGEGYGAKIQKGGENYSVTQNFVLFDVRICDWWLMREDVYEIASELSLEVVPIVGSGTLREMVAMVMDGFESKWGPFLAEGIVARPAVELKSRNGGRIITKVKYKDFARR